MIDVKVALNWHTMNSSIFKQSLWKTCAPILLISLISLTAYADTSNSQAQLMTDQQILSSGKELFQRHCTGCHGVEADGKGPAAAMLSPKPRNLVKGSFKFRSTPSGSLPTTADLIRTIDQGVLGASMPSFKFLSQSEKLALATFVKSLRKDWAANEGETINIPSTPKDVFSKKPMFLASAMRGYKTFQENCATCHGTQGLGDGESAASLVDDDNMPIKPANYTRPYIKSGRSARDIFKAITTGLDGTPMPSFGEVFSETQRWELVSYVMFRRGQGMGIYPADKTLEQLAAEFPVAAANAPEKKPTPAKAR